MLWFGWELPEILIPAAAILLGLWAITCGGHTLSRWARDSIRQGRGQTKAGDERAQRLGYIERACVGALALAGPVAALSGVVAWASFKLQTNWGRREPETEAEEETVRIGGVSAGLGSLVSLTTALLGGLLIRVSVPL